MYVGPPLLVHSGLPVLLLGTQLLVPEGASLGEERGGGVAAAFLQ